MSHSFARQGARQHGYTLVELMAVVFIVGVLAVIATYGVRRYIQSTKSTEAVHMIGAIKAAQEAWRDETFQYLDASVSSFDSIYPQGEVGKVGKKKYSWQQTGDGVAANWRLLNVTSGQAVQYGYSCVAGTGASADAAWNAVTATNLLLETVSLDDLTKPTEPWYVVRAIGDLDEDGEYSTFVSMSFTSQIFSEREDE